jgi:two-component system response regulator HydG
LTGEARILVVDDEADMAESCVFLLRRAGHDAEPAGSADAALARLEHEAFDVVVTDLRMPGRTGLQLLAAIKQRDPDIEVLVITGFPEIQTAVAAIKAGAFDYLEKPFEAAAFVERVEKAVAHKDLKTRNRELRLRLRQGAGGRRLVHRSPAFRALLDTLERAAKTEASVLIHGESGTGKELLAHVLHDQSPRAGRPFVPVDCTTIPETLVESELFGHVKGAFSGADHNRTGLFEVANGGTLFLDEVGELPLSFQPKLLRAIQERQIRRVGASELRPVDVRLVAATNRDLPAMVAQGRFRQDLFYRLDVVRLEVPPLRARPEDIEPLARHFLAALQGDDARIVDLDPQALAVLKARPWPGNVRQLRNVIERACVLGSGPTLTVADLPPDLGDPAPADAPQTFQELKAREVAALERSYVENLLRKHAGHVTRCAEEAGMARSAFQKLMQRYGIRSESYRGAKS